MEKQEPSIEYLELFALCAGICAWKKELSNMRIIVLRDNQAVVAMVNSITSSCANCMHLLWLLTLNGLLHNRRIFANYIDTKSNFLPDAISRFQWERFRKLGPWMNEYPDKVPECIWQFLRKFGRSVIGRLNQTNKNSFVVKRMTAMKTRRTAKEKQLKKNDSSSVSTTSSRISTRDLRNIVEKLKANCHRGSTRKMYYQTWKKFANFLQRLDFRPPSWEERITLFVGFLVDQDKQSSTVKSHLSVIRAVLKIDGIKLDEDMFMINALTRACKLQNDKVKTRLPIHKALLERILNQLQKHYLGDQSSQQPYLCSLYQTLFATAYYGLFRVGELTSGSHPVLAKDVQVATNKKKIKFTLHSSKTHGKGNLLQTIKISSTDNPNAMRVETTLPHHCPYQLLDNFGKR